MIVYSVTIAIQAGIESEWVDWMNKVHVPDVLRTGCFSECRFYKALGSEGDELTYVPQYHCRSLEEYHRYRDNFAPALQKEHTDRFSGRFLLDFYDAAFKTGNAPQALADTQRDWLVKLRKEKGLLQAVRLAGPFIMSSQGKP